VLLVVAAVLDLAVGIVTFGPIVAGVVDLVRDVVCKKQFSTADSCGTEQSWVADDNDWTAADGDAAELLPVQEGFDVNPSILHPFDLWIDDMKNVPLHTWLAGRVESRATGGPRVTVVDAQSTADAPLVTLSVALDQSYDLAMPHTDLLKAYQCIASVSEV
jgi:hypothetical protein